MGPIARILGVLITVLSLAAPALARPHRWRNLVFAGALAPDPANPGTLYIVSGSTVFRSTDVGENWTIAGVLHEETSALAVDGSSPGTLYAAGPGGLFKSSDGGATWNLVNSGSTTQADGFSGVEVFPGSPVRVFTFAYALSSGANDGVYESTDGGSSWEVLDVPGGVVEQMAADPHDEQTLYAAAESLPAGSGGGLFRSTDGGVSWTALLGGSGTPLGVSSIELDPLTGSLLYAATDQGLLESGDGGSTWSAFGGGLPAGSVISVLVNPVNPQWLYAGSGGSGVFRSFDGGTSWFEMIGGWPPPLVAGALFITGGSLVALTDGGEFAWDLTADTCAPDSQTLCLNADRFIAQATWRDFQGNSGPASVVPGAASDSSGVLWFFSPDNWELLVKVLDGCGVNGRYWVFGAAATNVQYILQVTDTETGEVKSYVNPLETVSSAITDTSAFASCP